jgi:hypothetical protein
MIKNVYNSNAIKRKHWKKREQSASQNVFKMSAFLRIHWLPLDVSDDKISEFIRLNLPEVSIVNLNREKARSVR